MVNKEIHPSNNFIIYLTKASKKWMFFCSLIFSFTLNPIIICPIVPPKEETNKGSYKRKMESRVIILALGKAALKREKM